MRDDWTAGDLALCVAANGWSDNETGRHSRGPECGQILQVMQVVTVVAEGKPAIYLKFKPWVRSGYLADGFRKITPGAKIHGVEAEARHPLPSLWPVPA